MNAVSAEVELCSPSGAIRYADSGDHFDNALLRLMGLDRKELERWLELADEEAGDVLVRLRRAFARLRPMELAAEDLVGPVAPGPGGEHGHVWHPAIAESREFGVARSSDGGIGWLVRPNRDGFEREVDAPVYEEEYFEGDKLAAGGYGEYSAQAGWRLEKAERQVRELRDATGLERGRVLDVGCGYGYFRVALERAGLEHDGLEVSAFARAVAKQEYSFDTFAGSLEDHWREWGGRYDAITGFDLIEHVPDPVAFLEQVAHCLRPGGVVALKTPNIDCPEAEVFGPHYHSLKREHLVFFTPRSVRECAATAGLETLGIDTISHLLVGFVGPERTAGWARDGRGADLNAYLRTPT